MSLPVITGAGLAANMNTVAVDDLHTPVHLEDTTQRAALITALTAIVSALSYNATGADIASVVTALARVGLVKDSAGNYFNPEDCSIVPAYNGSNYLITETATDGAVVRVRTYGYTGANLTSISKWVVQ